MSPALRPGELSIYRVEEDLCQQEESGVEIPAFSSLEEERGGSGGQSDVEADDRLGSNGCVSQRADDDPGQRPDEIRVEYSSETEDLSDAR